MIQKIMTHQTHESAWNTMTRAVCSSEQLPSTYIFKPVKIATYYSLWNIKNKTLVEYLSNRSNVWKYGVLKALCIIYAVCSIAIQQIQLLFLNIGFFLLLAQLRCEIGNGYSSKQHE